MISKNKAKFIKSLQIKKFREEYNQFVVEGAKSVLELLQSDFKIHLLAASVGFLKEHRNKLKAIPDIELMEATEEELGSVSSFKTNNSAIAVAEFKSNSPLNPEKEEFVLMLDHVRDPGNMGTIIRIADWYGIRKIICSEASVDFYNPKVISASMGSFTRVQAYYTNLLSFLEKNKAPVYAAELTGENVHQISFERNGILLMGNESEGVSVDLKKYITKSVHIPRFGMAESLNVAVATAVICDNLRRNKE